jgi:hypothetical protein
MDPIVSTFRKVSTKLDQGHRPHAGHYGEVASTPHTAESQFKPDIGWREPGRTFWRHTDNCAVGASKSDPDVQPSLNDIGSPQVALPKRLGENDFTSAG